MQKVERLVALGNFTRITIFGKILARANLFCSSTESVNLIQISLQLQVADGDLPIVASHG